MITTKDDKDGIVVKMPIKEKAILSTTLDFYSPQCNLGPVNVPRFCENTIEAIEHRLMTGSSNGVAAFSIIEGSVDVIACKFRDVNIPISSNRINYVSKCFDDLKERWIGISGEIEGKVVDIKSEQDFMSNLVFSSSLSYLLRVAGKRVGEDTWLQLKRRGTHLNAGDTIHIYLLEEFELVIKSPNKIALANLRDVYINVVDGSCGSKDLGSISIEREGRILEKILDAVNEVKAKGRDNINHYDREIDDLER